MDIKTVNTLELSKNVKILQEGERINLNTRAIYMRALFAVNAGR